MKPNKNKESAAPSLKKLEYLSLVSKVCTELESHLGFSDKTLAEFITDLGHKCLTVDDFDKKLKKNRADLPDYFVRTLLNVIHAILPPKVKKPKGEVGEKGALGIGDSREHVRTLEKEIEMEALEKARLRGENSDKLENAEILGSRSEKRENRDGYDRKRDDRYERKRGDRDNDRVRNKDRDNERRRDDRDRDRGENEVRRRDRDNDRYERENESRSHRERTRDKYDKKRDERDRDDGKERVNRRMDELELYQVYRGRVTRIMDSGCFVEILDVKGKEGLVHVSQIATRRVASAKDMVKRDQE
nr:probable pre-mRNA-splicing factor ATP-dependent RNA helicase DEAH5 [Tanacetum cinerariifolium]